MLQDNEEERKSGGGEGGAKLIRGCLQSFGEPQGISVSDFLSKKSRLLGFKDKIT